MANRLRKLVLQFVGLEDVWFATFRTLRAKGFTFEAIARSASESGEAC